MMGKNRKGILPRILRDHAVRVQMMVDRAADLGLVGRARGHHFSMITQDCQNHEWKPCLAHSNLIEKEGTPHGLAVQWLRQ